MILMENSKKESGVFKIITIILAIIVVVLLAVLIYTNYSKQDTIANGEDKAGTQINTEMSKNVYDEDLNEKSDVNSNLTETIPDSTVKSLLQKYLDLKGALAGSPENLLVELGFIKYGESNGESVDIEGVPYVATSIKSSDFKNVMLGYVSEKCYEQEFTKWFKFFDNLYYRDAGGSGAKFEVVSVSRVTDTEYTAKVYEIMFDNSKELREYKVKIVNEDGCFIDSCELI